MDIKKVVDAAARFRNDNPSATDDEAKLHAFEYLLSELKQSSAEELLPHFRSLDLKKTERQVVVTLTFPWEITFSNIVYGESAPEIQKRTSIAFTKEDERVMSEIATRSSSVPFVKPTNRDNH
ncbi:hypothetical protein P4H71_04420 [Paenibacillus kribbensis]|uniref:hypothetical protein n=1 Tax=Paenibacillus kribbensis TaxID=172713 RepID=UPI002DB784F2|nr:hypothetical protein [Paenibacillus kribbensis]MEC0233600.1 hypothetical protein [Paenibacillus kribbensis]